MNKERLLQRFLQYVTCASETYQEREFCIMMEEELTSLGLHWERQEIGEMFGSNGWNLHAILPGTGAPLLLCAHMDTVAPGYGISPILRDGVIYSDGTTILAVMIKPVLLQLWRLSRRLLRKACRIGRSNFC